MKKTRLARVNDEIKREVSTILRGELQDPRIDAMTSVTKVDTANDLSLTKIHVSIFGDDEKKAGVMEGLENASGFIRRLIAERINLRKTPQIKFVIDDSLDYSEKIDKLLNEANKKDNE